MWVNSSSFSFYFDSVTNGTNKAFKTSPVGGGGGGGGHYHWRLY